MPRSKSQSGPRPGGEEEVINAKLNLARMRTAMESAETSGILADKVFKLVGEQENFCGSFYFMCGNLFGASPDGSPGEIKGYATAMASAKSVKFDESMREIIIPEMVAGMIGTTFWDRVRLAWKILFYKRGDPRKFSTLSEAMRNPIEVEI